MRRGLIIVLLLGALVVSAQGGEMDTEVEILVSCATFFQDQLSGREMGLQINMDGLEYMYSVCNHPAFFNKLSDKDRQAISAFSADVTQQRILLGDKKVAVRDRMVTEIVNGIRGRSCPQQESTTADVEILQLWTTMRSALQKNDLEKALACFHEENREEYRTSFEKLRGEPLIEVAGKLGDPVNGKFEGNTATYRLNRKENGKNYSFDLNLILDENCQWKIISY